MSGQATPAKITAHPTALISHDTSLQGEITISAGVIVHPKASILAINGAILVGKDCVVDDLAVIINRSGKPSDIGEGNHFMIGCHVESPSIGKYNTFQPRSIASSSVHVSDYCTISAGTILLPSDPTSTTPETLPPYTVIYGASSERRTWDGSTQNAEMHLREKHLEYLREILPKYNKMRVV